MILVILGNCNPQLVELCKVVENLQWVVSCQRLQLQITSLQITAEGRGRAQKIDSTAAPNRWLVTDTYTLWQIQIPEVKKANTNTIRVVQNLNTKPDTNTVREDWRGPLEPNWFPWLLIQPQCWHGATLPGSFVEKKYTNTHICIGRQNITDKQMLTWWHSSWFFCHNRHPFSLWMQKIATQKWLHVNDNDDCDEDEDQVGGDLISFKLRS